MPSLIAPIQISLLAMGVIFVVLTILIAVIKALDFLLPYVEPPAPSAKSQPAGGQEDETIAAIHAAMAHHLGQALHQIQITRIQPGQARS